MPSSKHEILIRPIHILNVTYEYHPEIEVKLGEIIDETVWQEVDRFLEDYLMDNSPQDVFKALYGRVVMVEVKQHPLAILFEDETYKAEFLSSELAERLNKETISQLYLWGDFRSKEDKVNQPFEYDEPFIDLSRETEKRVPVHCLYDS